MSLGNHETAVVHFRRALGLDPGYEVARRNLDLVLGMREDEGGMSGEGD